MIEIDSVCSVVIHGDCLQQDFLDALRQNSIAAVGVAGDAEIVQLHAPEAELAVLIKSLGREMHGWRAFLVVVDQDSRGTAAYDLDVFGRHAQGFGQVIFPGRDKHHRALGSGRINRGLEVVEFGRVNAGRSGGGANLN